MKTLGIDYGRSKVGLALGVNDLVEPLKVLHYSDIDDLIGQIRDIAKEEGVEKIIVGLSEGEMGEESKRFAKRLGAITFDETLSSQDAQRISRESGVPQKRRREMEDAYAATLILQNYLDFQA